MAELYYVELKDVARVWPFIKEDVERIVARFPQCTADGFLEDCLGGDVQIWIVMEGREKLCTVLTCLVEYHAWKAARVIGLAGKDMGSWIHMTPRVEAWAKDNGCKTIEIWGRKGWKRVHGGYDERITVLEKEL